MQSRKLSGGFTFIITTFFCDNLRKKFGSETRKMQAILAGNKSSSFINSEIKNCVSFGRMGLFSKNVVYSFKLGTIIS